MSAAKKEPINADQVASELTESAYFQPTKPQVHKPLKPLVEKYTTHLYPTTIKKIKAYAFHHEMKDYEVVQRALTEFFMKYEETSK
jgi:hypothetical protein